MASTGPVYADVSESTVAYLAYTEGYWQVWIMSPEGREQRQITHSIYDKSRISWFPAGKYLLVNGNQGDLVKVGISSGTEAPIETSLAGMSDAVLSPDGNYIAFSLSTSDSIDDNNIWIVNVDGGNPRKLTNMKGLQHDPVWSSVLSTDRHGQWIYFLSGTGGQAHDIWRISIKGGKKEQLTVGQLYHFDLALSQKGDLAFSSNRYGNYEIWAQSKNGQAQKLTNHPGLDARPTWSPDSGTLLFESSRSGTANIWRLAVANPSPHQITYHSVGARYPVWFQGMRKKQ